MRASRSLARVLFVVVASILGVRLAACGPGDDSRRGSAAPPSPRLVLLYVSCTVRSDALQPYNPEVEFTPKLARFAHDSVVFERHQSEAGQSGIAFASILTGQHAMQHGVYAHPRRLRDEQQLLTEAFADAGYDAFYFEQQGMAAVSLNYGQGAPRDQQYGGRKLTMTDPKFRAILSHLESDPTYRAFIVSFYSLTHAPYPPHATATFCRVYPRACTDVPAGVDSVVYDHWREFSYDLPNALERYGVPAERLPVIAASLRNRYLANVNAVDRVFGQIVAAIDERSLRDDSLIVFTADHGEVLYRDNAIFPWTHGHALAPEVLQVPLIIRPPRSAGIEPGRFRPVTESVDLFDTLLGLAGLPAPEGKRRGHDLSQWMRRGSAPPDRIAFSHTSMLPIGGRQNEQERFRFYHPANDPERIWVRARKGDRVLKYRRLASGEFGYEAFDLSADPEERENLYSPEDESFRELREELTKYREELTRGYAARGSRAQEPEEEEQIEALRSLGYIDDAAGADEAR